MICYVPRPSDVFAMVSTVRDDILESGGGILVVPGSVAFGFNFGLPPGKAGNPMAETVALALEGRFDDNALAGAMRSEQVEEMASVKL